MADIDALQTASTALISEIRTAAEDATKKLENLVGPLTFYGFNPKSSVELNKASVDFSGVSWPEMTLEDFTVNDLGDFDPGALKENIWSSDTYDAIQRFIDSSFEDGGPWVKKEVQDALFDDQNERDLQLLNDSMLAVRSTYGKTGFPLPTGMMRGQENELVKKYQFDRANRNREILALMMEKSSQWFKEAAQVGVSIEESRMNFTLGWGRLFSDITTAIIARHKAKQDTFVAQFEGDLKVLLSRIETARLNSTLDLTFQDQLIKYWEVESQQSIERVKTLIAETQENTRLQISAAAALSDFYKGISSAAATQITGITSISENTEKTP